MSSEGGSTRVLGADAPAAATALPPGAVIGEWRIVRHIAAGGFGMVYEVAHVVDGTRGALKALHGHLLTSPEMTARLVREAQVIAQLRHPHVVQLLAADTDDSGQPYLVMEYLEGRDLAEAIAARGRLPPADALAILEPLCAAVAAAHDRGVVHRDIKASNVFLCGDPAAPRVVLLDFGIAKLLDDAGADLTASRQALGTPSSMAPEQIRGEPVDGRADVYALGALAYHLLTGRMAFEDVSVTMSQYMHLHAARPRPSETAPLDPAADEVVSRAMAIDRARRHPDALAFFSALRGAIGETAAAAAPEVTRALGLLVSVQAGGGAGSDDDALLDDVDAVLPLAERELAAGGFVFARDLGEAVLFVRPDIDRAAARAAVRAAAAAVDARPGRDPRVAVRFVLHEADVVLVEGRASGGPLCDPAGWGLPDDADGIWIGDGGVFARLT